MVWENKTPWGGEPDQAPSFPGPTASHHALPGHLPCPVLSYLPQYFHLVPPPQRQLIWGLRLVVEQDPVDLRAGDCGRGRGQSGEANSSPQINQALPPHQLSWVSPFPKSGRLEGGGSEEPFGWVLTCPQVVWRAVIGQTAQLVGAGGGRNKLSPYPAKRNSPQPGPPHPIYLGRPLGTRAD